jgi:hypothetical protein
MPPRKPKSRVPEETPSPLALVEALAAQAPPLQVTHPDPAVEAVANHMLATPEGKAAVKVALEEAVLGVAPAATGKTISVAALEAAGEAGVALGLMVRESHDAPEQEDDGALDAAPDLVLAPTPGRTITLPREVVDDRPLIINGPDGELFRLDAEGAVPGITFKNNHTFLRTPEETEALLRLTIHPAPAPITDDPATPTNDPPTPAEMAAACLACPEAALAVYRSVHSGKTRLAHWTTSGNRERLVSIVDGAELAAVFPVAPMPDGRGGYGASVTIDGANQPMPKDAPIAEARVWVGAQAAVHGWAIVGGGA